MTRGAVPDLSLDGIAARAEARRKTGREGGYTGRELVRVAGEVLNRAVKLQREANRKRGSRRGRRLDDEADRALMTAALQIRLAQWVPSDRPYLHVLDLPRIQAAREEVFAFVRERGTAELAVDTSTRIREQRLRHRAGGDP
jgi:hypothetical protein